MFLFLSLVRTPSASSFFFFNDTATTEIYTLSLHDALPICHPRAPAHGGRLRDHHGGQPRHLRDRPLPRLPRGRSEEHTSELQSRLHLVCRLLLEKKKKQKRTYHLQRKAYLNKYEVDATADK